GQVPRAAVADVQALDLQQCRHRAIARFLGSSQSRRPSPTRVKPTTMIRMAMAGAATTHGEGFMKSRPVDSIRPSDGVGGGPPRPMKLSAASSNTDTPSRMDACTITGPMLLGAMCRATSRQYDAPRALAASTKLSLLVSRAAARITLATIGV